MASPKTLNTPSTQPLAIAKAANRSTSPHQPQREACGYVNCETELPSKGFVASSTTEEHQNPKIA
ncbi:hypothetical protein CGZ80_16285 [Rhodopirellula sp. MGV]|nr:hypothetical protein CGZ80_16285 [Rhodopirellula sp. MGV]PNY38021.1 hypothetical protein C2E31_04480 [Rhodopirellula baltica]